MEEAKLKRSLGLTSAISMIIGVIVGSGIFISPVDMYKATNSVGLSLLAWIFCGAIASLGAICFAELGYYIEDSGGYYIYTCKGLGDMYGFLIMWVCIFVIYPTTITAVALTSSKNLLQYAYMNQQPPQSAVVIICICILMFIISINLHSVEWSNWLQKFLTLVKTFVLIVILAIGVYNVIRGKYGLLDQTFVGLYENMNGNFVMALYQGIFAYAGWYSLNFMTEELINPYRTLPLAILISMPFITLIYVMVSAAYFTELTADELLNSSAVAVSFAYNINKYFAYAMPIFVGCSCLGSLNGLTMFVTRIYFVAARNKHLPISFSLVNATKTPGFSIIFTGIISCLYLVVPYTDFLISCMVFMDSIAIWGCTIILIKIKKDKKYADSAMKLNIIWVYLFFIVQSVVVIAGIIYQFTTSALTVGLMIPGIFVYLFVVKKQRNIKCITNLTKKLNHTYQKIFMAIPESKSLQNVEKDPEKVYQTIKN